VRPTTVEKETDLPGYRQWRCTDSATKIEEQSSRLIDESPKEPNDSVTMGLKA